MGVGVHWFEGGVRYCPRHRGRRGSILSSNEGLGNRQVAWDIPTEAIKQRFRQTPLSESCALLVPFTVTHRLPGQVAACASFSGRVDAARWRQRRKSVT